VIAGLAWWFFPFWIFFVLVNAFYWASWFHVGTFAVPLFLTLLLGAVSAPSWWAAALLGGALWCILGAKELLFIHRTRAYEVLALILIFLGALQMGMLTRGLPQAAQPLAYLAPGLALFLLRESASRYEEDMGSGGEVRWRILRSALGGLLFWGYGSVLAGLPLEGVPKSMALFAAAATLFFLLGKESREEGVRRWVGFALVALLAALLLARWEL
jgi:hypothetical protein